MDRAAARIAARGHTIVSSSPVLVVDREGSVILDPREERRIIPGEPDEADRDVLALHAALATERERREAAEAAVVTLRAIVEGRTVAPTDAEIAAHGGEWRCVGAGAAYAEISGLVAAGLRDVARGVTLRWWPLDATGRPCSWPKVQP